MTRSAVRTGGSSVRSEGQGDLDGAIEEWTGLNGLHIAWCEAGGGLLHGSWRGSRRLGDADGEVAGIEVGGLIVLLVTAGGEGARLWVGRRERCGEDLLRLWPVARVGDWLAPHVPASGTSMSLLLVRGPTADTGTCPVE